MKYFTKLALLGEPGAIANLHREHAVGPSRRIADVIATQKNQGPITLPGASQESPPAPSWKAGTTARTQISLNLLETESRRHIPIKNFTKQAAKPQITFRTRGKRVFQDMKSNSFFPGSKQPNLDYKYFERTDEIKDFGMKQLIRRNESPLLKRQQIR